MTCQACGAESGANAKFCSQCGRPLALSCPGCGATAAPNARFCSDCGRPLAQDGAPPPASGAGQGSVAQGTPAASPARGAAPSVPDGWAGGALPPGAERRLVSVMFADLVDFTTFSDGKDTEVVRDLLSRYFEAASEIIERYGGTIEKFIGDAVMAVWGATRAHEDDAERAVRAGLDLVAAVAELGREQGLDLAARAGVLTGETAVTIGATNQGLVVGEVVNTAARLQSSAPAGAVYTGESTRAAAARSIAFEPVGELTLKGISAPVATWRALRVVAKARGVGRSDGLEPPFIGRDAEFRLVREAYHAVARERRARLVSITGEAGIGKSRLGWEFSKYTDGLASTMYWHEGRSPAYGEGISFWALSEMVRKRAGLLEGDDEESTRRRIAETLDRYVPDEGERSFVEACLLTLLGIGEPPPGGHERLFGGWRLFFERLASEDPVVLLFEDLHWADDGLLDFIESLLEWSQSYPIFVVTLARPELLERRPTWGAGRAATSLPLGPLGDEAMTDLIRGLVPAMPASASSSILERAGGIPLYAVETIRMLVGSGRLEQVGDGTFRPVGDLGTIDVPPSLQALIAARLDALPAPDRALLQDAAVLGQTFAVPALAAVTGEDREALEPRLRSLVARDLLSLDTDPRSPERGQYGFVQALIREVSYGTLAKRDRRTRHLAAARYFEALGDEELMGALATHYLAAYEAVLDGPEAGALAAQARIALRAAAERAAALGAPEQAMNYFDAAARLPGDERERLELLERAGSLGESSGRHQRAQERYREAAEGWRALGDRRAAARATGGYVVALFANDMEAGREIAERALEEFADLGAESAEMLDLRFAVARVLLRIGHNPEAAALLAELMPAIERTGDTAFVLRGLAARGATLPSLGQPIEGAILLEGVVQRALAASLMDIADTARINLSVTVTDDDVRAGRDIAAAGYLDAVRRGAGGSAAFFALNSGEYDLHIGTWESGRRRLAEVLEIGLEANDRFLCSGTAAVLDLIRGVPVDLAEVLRLAGPTISTADLRTWAALIGGDGPATVATGFELAREDELNAPFTYFRVAIGAALAGDARSAVSAGQELTALVRTGRWVKALRVATTAIADAMDGRVDDGVQGAGTAMERFRSQGVVLDAALLALGMAAALRGRPEAAPFADEARAILTQLGSPPLLALVDQVAGEPTRPSREREPRAVASAGGAGDGREP